MNPPRLDWLPIAWLALVCGVTVILAIESGRRRKKKHWTISLALVVAFALLSALVGSFINQYAEYLELKLIHGMMAQDDLASITPRSDKPVDIKPTPRFRFEFVIEEIVVHATLVGLLIGTLGLVVRDLVAWRMGDRLKEGHCWKCGYNLTGNTTGICPECGLPRSLAK